MAYTYNQFLNALALVSEIPTDGSNTAFLSYVPTIIDQAEQYLYRELDLLSVIIADTSGFTTPNQRRFTLPQHFVVIQSINILNGSARTVCGKRSREVVDFLFPSDTANPGDVPNVWAPFTDQVIYLAPSPSSNFQVEVIGEIRPAPLSASNTTTFLSQYLSDLFFACAVIAACGYMQDYGAQADNAQLAVSWTKTRDDQLPSAKTEETRKKFQAFASV